MSNLRSEDIQVLVMQDYTETVDTSMNLLDAKTGVSGALLCVLLITFFFFYFSDTSDTEPVFCPRKRSKGEIRGSPNTKTTRSPRCLGESEVHWNLRQRCKFPNLP